MTVSVSIPTILRTHTGGEKRVTATGETLQAVISDLESNYSGISERLVDSGKLQRFVNIYVNDEDVRFSGGLDTEINDGDTVTILPAVAGGSESEVLGQARRASGGGIVARRKLSSRTSSSRGRSSNTFINCLDSSSGMFSCLRRRPRNRLPVRGDWSFRECFIAFAH